MQQRVFLVGASVMLALLFLAVAAVASAAVHPGSTSSLVTTAAIASSITAGASATTTASSALSDDETATRMSSIQKYYREICHPPKSCSIDNGSGHNKKSPCSYNTLRGLSTTRKSMQTRQEYVKDDSIEASIALKQHLSHVKMEEASVGCALLMYHHQNNHPTGNTNSGDDDHHDPEMMIRINFVEGVLQKFVREHKNTIDGDGGDICPKPNTCQFSGENNSEHNNGNFENMKTCDDHHSHQLKKTINALEISHQETDFDDNASDTINDNVEKMARQLELAELRAETATVGCVLMMQHEIVQARMGTNENGIISATTSSAGDNAHKKEMSIIIYPSLAKYQKDEEKFQYFLQQNYNHFTGTTSDETNSLVKGLEQIQNKRTKIETVLNTAGMAGIPEIIWQERLSRERAVERLTDEAHMVRIQLLEMLQQRIIDGELSLSDLDRKYKPQHTNDKEEDTWHVWDKIAEQLDGKEETRLNNEMGNSRLRRKDELERAKRKEMRAVGERINRAKVRQLSNQDYDHNVGRVRSPTPAYSPSQECNVNSSNDNKECTADPEAQRTMIERMKEDIILLREKAMRAKSVEERDARLNWVHEVEKQLGLMLKSNQ